MIRPGIKIGVALLAGVLVAAMLYVNYSGGACERWQNRYQSVLAEFDTMTPSPLGDNQAVLPAEPYENLANLEPAPDGCAIPDSPGIRTGPSPTGARIQG